MADHEFPAQKDLCALCARPLDLNRLVAIRGLPWVFCSRECAKAYAAKDGEPAKEDGRG